MGMHTKFMVITGKISTSKAGALKSSVIRTVQKFTKQLGVLNLNSKQSAICKKKNKKGAKCLTIKTPDQTPSFQVQVLGSDTEFQHLIQLPIKADLEVSADGSSNWISATSVGDLD